MRGPWRRKGLMVVGLEHEECLVEKRARPSADLWGKYIIAFQSYCWDCCATVVNMVLAVFITP